MSKKKPDDFMDTFLSGKKPESRQKPTKDDNVNHTQTNADNVSRVPTDMELVRITARIAKWQKNDIEAIAARDGRLLSDIVREAIRDYLRKEK